MALQGKQCKFLALPAEIRLQIWTLLLTPPTPLVMRCLFIRDHYRSVFMTQQPKNFTIAILRLCKQTTAEVLPILYGQPLWRAACRSEALASQVGISNFGLIKRICVDIDDLPTIVGSLVLDMQENEHSPQLLKGMPTVELKLEMESRALMENMMLDATSSEMLTPAAAISQRRLRFANLEVLEVEGYQTVALSQKGSRRSRLEGLRLCNFARQILSYHPTLDVLVQQAKVGNGGSDAVDLTMGRVRWRFLRTAGTSPPAKSINEYNVDLDELEDLLRVLVELHEEGAASRRSEREKLPGWMEDGSFRQYPYLTSVFTAG